MRHRKVREWTLVDTSVVVIRRRNVPALLNGWLVVQKPVAGSHSWTANKRLNKKTSFIFVVSD